MSDFFSRIRDRHTVPCLSGLRRSAYIPRATDVGRGFTRISYNMGKIITDYTQALEHQWDLEFDSAPESEVACAKARAEELRTRLELSSGKDEEGFTRLILYMYAGEQRKRAQELEAEVRTLKKRLYEVTHK